MTKPNTIPYTFSAVGQGKSILIPPGTYTPYNAQATVHTYPALWATLLPMTVPGEPSGYATNPSCDGLLSSPHYRCLYPTRA